MELHATQIQGFFDIPADDISAIPIIGKYFKELNLQDVVVVSPDHGGLKEDAFGRGVTADDVLQEARRVADGYIRRNSRWSRLWRHIPAPAYVAAGALGATVCWCVALVL